jgi:hypothetical protein
VPVVGWQTTLQRSEGEPGAELYRRAQAELEARFKSLPERPALGEPGGGPATLDVDWDVLIGVHPAELWKLAAERLREWAGDFAERDDGYGAGIYFVDDARVKYDRGPAIYVRRKDLFQLYAHHRWAEFLCPRPTWLHFNLLPNVEGLSIVTLCRSPVTMAEDDPRPIAVNVSAMLSADGSRLTPLNVRERSRPTTVLEPPRDEVRPGEIRGLVG